MLLAGELSALDREIKSMQELHQQQLDKMMAFQSIINISWNEIDVASILDHLSQLQRNIDQLQQGNQALKQLGEEIDRQCIVLSNQQKKLTVIQVQRATKEGNLKERQDELAGLNNEISAIKLTLFQQEKLSNYFKIHKDLTLKNIQDIARSVERTIQQEKDILTTDLSSLQNNIERIFQQFKNSWPQEGADLDASLAATPEFIAKLVRIEHDGLPAHEERFFNMLRDQSMENLAALNTHLSQARKDILSRMEMVNESLREVEYNPGTNLEIEVTDRQLDMVRMFRTQIRDILNCAWNNDRELAEKNFNILRELVKQLTGQDAEQQRWRQQVLDVRLHVEFIAREYDKDKNEIEVHRSGAGKSGGQREKLATTCLAAALCYQLGGQQGGIPLYASVVLDEAFSKADNEFTQEVMKIFTKFGFQMIVATPLKSVMTLEPFIAGACFVDIAERKHSSTLHIHYLENEQRLDLPDVAA